jgi:hypothetical protein
VVKAQAAGAEAPETTDVTGRRLRLASPATALIVGGLVLALAVLDVPLARLAHQSLDASGGSSPFWFSVALGVVGFVVAWRRPRNPLGWILLGGAAFGALSQDASFYGLCRAHNLLKRLDDCLPCRCRRVGDREVVADDLTQLCVLARGLGGGHVSHALCERDPVVGLGVHAAHDARDGHLGQRVGHCVPVRVLAGSTAHEIDDCPVSALLTGCGTKVEDSGEADDAGEVDRGLGTGGADGQLAPAGGPGGQVAAGAVAYGHHPVGVCVGERSQIVDRCRGMNAAGLCLPG